MGCANGQLQLLSRDGLPLLDIEQHDSPVLSLAMHPNGTLAAVACKGGRLTVHQLIMSTVHGLYGDIYAHRQDFC